MESSLILVILVAIILLVITIYCALMSHKLIFFNDAKFRTIFKDSLALIIIPLLVNIFSNKLKLKTYVTCVILLSLLFVAYLLADTWDKPKTNDKHIIRHMATIILLLLLVLISYIILKYLEIKFNFDIR
ncbi:hypothetical protein ACM28P_08040 [Lactobacillus crispatus]